MEQLRPIFEALRQREELPCSYPLHVGSTHGTKQAFIYGHSRSQGSTTPGAHHYTHHHGYQPSPGYHWVIYRLCESFAVDCTFGKKLIAAIEFLFIFFVSQCFRNVRST